MNKLPDRLKFARERLELSQQQVADAVGMKQPSYYQLEAGKSKRSRFINDIARVLQTDADWLMYGHGDSCISSRNTDTPNNTEKVELSHGMNGMVPVISWVAAGSFDDVIPVTINDAVDWIPRPQHLSERAFGLVIQGRSMCPEFKPDDIIYVEPEISAWELKDGDLIVIHCEDDKQATFKQLVIGDSHDDMYLKPLNPDWPDQRMTPMGECSLVGIVDSKFVRYR